MLTVFNLVEANTAKLLPILKDFLSKSPHVSRFNEMQATEIETEVLRIHEGGGIIMVLQNMGAPEGVAVLEKKNDQEVTLVDLVMKEGYLPRGIDTLISQIKRRVQREGFTQLFGPSTWFNSVKDPQIKGILAVS